MASDEELENDWEAWAEEIIESIIANRNPTASTSRRLPTGECHRLVEGHICTVAAEPLAHSVNANLVRPAVRAGDAIQCRACAVETGLTVSPLVSV